MERTKKNGENPASAKNREIVFFKVHLLLLTNSTFLDRYKSSQTRSLYLRAMTHRGLQG